MNARRALISAASLLLFAAPLAAQTISGRVTDSTGKPVSHARVLAHAWGDTTDAALRLAFSNDRGEYRLTLPARGKFVLTAFSVGFRPEPERAVDLADGDAKLDITMRKQPAILATVSIAEGDHSCAMLDSPYQSARVREWVLQIQNLIRSRRVIEREYSYQVHEAGDYRDASGHRRYRERDIPQRPTDSLHIGEVPAGRMHHQPAFGLDAGLDYWASPDEGTAINSYFTTVDVCFDTTLFKSGNGYEVRFKRAPGLDRIGTMRTTADGMLTEISFFTTGTLTYTSVTLDGESYPFIARVESKFAGMARRFTYSRFVHGPPRG